MQGSESLSYSEGPGSCTVFLSERASCPDACVQRFHVVQSGEMEWAEG